MSPYIAILPNSPLLLHAFEQQQYPETKKSFQKIREELRKRNINHILTIADSPRAERASFSAYIHPKYDISFADFGDLVTKGSSSVWMDAYQRLQNPPSQEVTIEPMDTSQIDYGHGIPIHLLQQLSQPTESLSFLALNNEHSQSKAERIKLGQHIAHAFHGFDLPYAILAFGSLYQTTTASLIKAVQIKNSKLRETILSGNLDFEETAKQKELLHPSLTHTLEILSGILPTEYQVKELSFEKDHRTSFLSAEIV